MATYGSQNSNNQSQVEIPERDGWLGPETGDTNTINIYTVTKTDNQGEILSVTVYKDDKPLLGAGTGDTEIGTYDPDTKLITFKDANEDEVAFFSQSDGSGRRAIHDNMEDIIRRDKMNEFIADGDSTAIALAKANKYLQDQGIANPQGTTPAWEVTDNDEYDWDPKKDGVWEKRVNTFTVTGVSKPGGTLWKEKAFSSRSKTLIYPEDHASEEFDFIKITPIEYVPAMGNLGTGDAAGNVTMNAQNDQWIGFKSIKDRYLRTKQVGSTMFLPMVPDISETNGVDWGGNTLNPLQATAGRIAFNAIGRLGNSASVDEVGQAIVATGQEMGAAASAFLKNDQIKTFIQAYFAGRAVNANILGRAGIVVNPNLEVLFNGPKLRVFSYNFRFTPRTESEATTIRTIIKVIKKTMAPKRRDKIFLTVPAVYKLRYIFNGDTNSDHPFLNKIKVCALSDLSVQYAPDGSYMTYDDGSMTSYNVSMKFNELEPIYNDDISDVDDATTGF